MKERTTFFLAIMFLLCGQILGQSSAEDKGAIWYYDCPTGKVSKISKVDTDTLTVRKAIQIINRWKEKKIVVKFVRTSVDTIYIKIPKSSYLTQQMGTCGANAFIATTTYTLTDIKDINYVNFDFEEGDHAVPGTYTRQFFTDRQEK